MSLPGNSGGSAAQAGISYQNRVAAWFAVRILAEKGVTALWDLHVDTTFEAIRCETEQPVDDILALTSDNGVVYIQVKHRVKLEKGKSSGFGSFIDQCVRQFITNRGMAPGKFPWERPLEINRDRLLLITTSNSSAAVIENFKSVLNKIRNLLPSQNIDDITYSKNEINALKVAEGHFNRSWNNYTANNPSKTEVKELLELIYVETLDVDEGGKDERDAKDKLKSIVLKDTSKSDLAWNALIGACHKYAVSRSGADRKSLQNVLVNSRIDLRSTTSYQSDIEKLKKHSSRTISELHALSVILHGNQEGAGGG